MAALQAVIPVARLSETEGSSNAVGGLEISAAIVVSRTDASLGANLYHGSPAHQKSSGKSRQLTPLFREKRPHCGHARSSRFESNRASPVPRGLRCPPI